MIRARFEPWYHYARILTRAGRPAEAAAAMDSSRARLPAPVRGRLTTNPLRLPPNSPLMEAWVGMPAPQVPTPIGVSNLPPPPSR